MIINIAYPDHGTQVKYEYKDEKKVAKLYDLRLGQEVEGDQFGEGFEGALFRITGGSDKNGFAMKQGVATQSKLRLLLKNDTVGLRRAREGTRFRKSVRGCIIGPEISCVNMVLVRKGEKEIPGLTDTKVPLRLGPKRANKIRKLFNLPRHSDNIGKKDQPKVSVSNIDVQRAVVKRVTKKVGDKTYYKAPRITRLLTTQRIRRKRARRQQKLQTIKANQQKLQDYKKQLEKRAAEHKAQRKQSHMK